MSSKKKPNERKARDSRSRRVLYDFVIKVKGSTNGVKLAEAVALYAEHHSITYDVKAPKDWLYHISLLWEQPLPLKNGNPAKVEKKSLPTIKIPKPKKEPVDLPTTLPAGLSNERFFRTGVWKRLRKKAMEYYGCACMRCGNRNTKNHVDHIYPRSKHPELELEFCNLQILCKDCNELKSNIYIWDLRPIKAKKWIDELASKGLIKPAIKLN
jgi:hypothetical protein